MSITKKILIVTGVLIIGAYVALLIQPDTLQKPTEPTQTVQRPNLGELADLVNKDRTDVGLAPLVRDPDLDASATDKCNDMVVKKYWAHVSPDGTDWKSFIKAHEQGFTRGENIAYGYSNSVNVNNGWLGSPEHKANILKDTYNEVGYAICDVEGYPNAIVQHFVGK